MRNKGPNWLAPKIAMTLYLLWSLIAVFCTVISFANEQWVACLAYALSIFTGLVITEFLLAIFEIHKELVQIRQQGEKPERERTLAEHMAARAAAQHNKTGEMRLG